MGLFKNQVMLYCMANAGASGTTQNAQQVDDILVYSHSLEVPGGNVRSILLRFLMQSLYIKADFTSRLFPS